MESYHSLIEGDWSQRNGGKYNLRICLQSRFIPNIFNVEILNKDTREILALVVDGINLERLSDKFERILH